MTSFIFVRHGKSVANLADEVATPDSPLSKEGAAQARKTGRDLKGRGITTIFTSPYPRARETAEIIAKQIHLENIEVVDDLRERGLGNYEGHKHEHPPDYNYIVDGKEDVEPRGVLIARCEAALSKIKKASEQGTVLVVGHAVSGFFLQQVASGKRLLAQFDPPKTPANAKAITVEIVDPARQPVSKDTAVVVGSLVLGLAALIAGIILMVNRPAQPQPGVKQQSIPLRPEDYQGDPHLQGAIQRLQEQQQSTQASGDAGSALQPNQGVPTE